MSSWGSPVEVQSEPIQDEFPLRPSSPISTPSMYDNGSPRPHSPVAGPSNEPTVFRLDSLFNFQIIVFRVEETLFQVLKNGFMAPGTPFEAMFSLPVPSDGSEPHITEGSDLTNPIYLPGVSTDEFRAFLKILYPFIGPSIVASYEDWVGILNLATMWEFKNIREQAISKLSTLIKEKPVPERIILGRTYRVKEWLKEEYVSLSQNIDFEMKELRDPSNIMLDWETIARIQSVREKTLMNNFRAGRSSSSQWCGTCDVYYGYNYKILDCRCRLPALVDELFMEEFKSLEVSTSDLPTSPSLPVNEAAGKKKGKKKK